MSKVKMTALDTFHATSVRAEDLTKGDKFEVSAEEADQLEERGLAKRAALGKAK